MSRTVLLLTLVACHLQVFSQKKEKEKNDMAPYETIYSFSMELKDYSSAANAAIILMSSDSESSWKDSLARTYFLADKPQLVVNLHKVLEGETSVFFKKLAAYSYLKIDSVTRSYSLMKEVYDSTGNHTDLADLAYLQYLDNQKTSSLQSLDQLQKLKDYRKRKVNFPIYSGTSVPLEAFVYYIQGKLLNDLQKPKEAIQMFDKAIAIHPEFGEAITEREKLIPDENTDE